MQTGPAVYLGLKRDAAAGVDGETWRHYGEELEANLRGLSDRLKPAAYRAKPVRRAYIPKADRRRKRRSSTWPPCMSGIFTHGFRCGRIYRLRVLCDGVKRRTWITSS